jgi:hypothetical protein
MSFCPLPSSSGRPPANESAKIAAAKKKGMWMGGMPPLGYDVKNRKLVVNDDEAHIAGDTYRRYLALKSVHALRDALAEPGSRASAACGPTAPRMEARGSPGERFI